MIGEDRQLVHPGDCASVSVRDGVIYLATEETNTGDAIVILSPADARGIAADLLAAADASDLSLVQRVQRGDKSAFDVLVRKYQHKVVKLVMRYMRDPADAEDVAQEAMLKAWRQAPKWTPGRARFDTWLHRVALNLCYDRLRRRREIPTDTPPERPDEGPAPDRGLLAAETGARVDAALAGLGSRGAAGGAHGAVVRRVRDRLLVRRDVALVVPVSPCFA